MKRRLACLSLLLAGCATKVGRDGKQEMLVDPKYLAKTEIDRVIDANRQELIAGLLRVADKLYRRNPREWRRAGLADRETALARLEKRQPLPALEGKRESEAALLAFRPDYPDDRVAALLFGLLTMVDAAFENREEFFVLNQLNEQKLYNCARNLEIAVWKLSTARDAAGELMLLSNEADATQRNLSFEREFGRLIGLLDFMARIVADTNGRSISRITQSLATALFLPVGLLK